MGESVEPWWREDRSCVRCGWCKFGADKSMLCGHPDIHALWPLGLHAPDAHAAVCKGNLWRWFIQWYPMFKNPLLAINQDCVT